MIHIHIHSEYSILDGCGSQRKFAERAKELGHTAIGFTEHGSMRGAHNQHNVTSEIGIKPIYGFEAYLVEDHTVKGLPIEIVAEIEDKFPPKERREAIYQAEIRNGVRPRYHITLIAETDEGLSNLFKLSSVGWKDGFASYGKGKKNGRPRVDFELLAGHAEGVVALSGCPGGAIAKELEEKNPRQALRNLERLLAIYGSESLYIEIMPHTSIASLPKTNEGLCKIARKFELPLVATQDAHYVNPEDWEPHEALLAITTHGNLISPTRFRFTGHEYWYKTEEEMREGFREQGLSEDAIDNAIESTDEIGERVHAKLAIDKFSALLPAIEIDEDLRGEFDAWRRKKRGKGIDD